MSTGDRSQPLSDGRPRLLYLDALRGLAALYVLVYHTVLLPEPDLVVPGWAERFARAGGTGVTLFFVVSAFSLCYTMPLRLREARPMRSFYTRRFFRIAPLFYFVLLGTLARDYWAFGMSHSAAQIAASVTFLFNLIPTQQAGFVWAGWTIGVEVVFYAVFPVIHRHVRTLTTSLLLVVASALLWLGVQLLLDRVPMDGAWRQSILDWSALKHFPIFAVGIVAHQLAARWVPNTARARLSGMALLVVGVLVYAFLLWGWLPRILGTDYYWQGIAYGCILLGLARHPTRLVVNRVTRSLGKVSYSVYLLHPTVVFFLAPAYHWIYGLTPSLTLGFLGSLLLSAVIVLPLASLTYRFVEEPGIRMGRRLASRWSRRAEPGPDASQAGSA